MTQRTTDTTVAASRPPAARVLPGFVRTLWPVLGSLTLVLVMLRFGIIPLAALATALAASWIAYRFHRLSVAALVLVVLVPQLLHMLQVLPEGWDVIGGGVRISDLILVGMWGAITVRLVNGDDRPKEERLFIAVSLLVAAVLLVAVARNWGVYGLSALGEFRFRYLILGLPVYLALGGDSAATRAWFIRWLVWAPVAGALLLLPVVSAEKGWALGEVSRFYPSWISLALLLAGVWVGLMNGEPQRALSRGVSYGVFAFVAVVIVKDAHRSVWLVAVACLIVLLVTRVVEVRRLWLWAAGAVTVGVIALVGLGALSSTLDYVVTRGQAFINPTEDPTSYWRLSVWRAYLQPFLEDPLFGQGFGGYWDVYVPELGARVITSPHSMYVQTLVKMGLLGMAALLGWFLTVFRLLVRSGFRSESVSQSRRVTLVLGLVAVVASLVYGAVYPLDFWLLAWIGLALAELFHGGAADAE